MNQYQLEGNAEKSVSRNKLTKCNHERRKRGKQDNPKVLHSDGHTKSVRSNNGSIVKQKKQTGLVAAYSHQISRVDPVPVQRTQPLKHTVNGSLTLNLNWLGVFLF